MKKNEKINDEKTDFLTEFFKDPKQSDALRHLDTEMRVNGTDRNFSKLMKEIQILEKEEKNLKGNDEATSL